MTTRSHLAARPRLALLLMFTLLALAPACGDDGASDSGEDDALDASADGGADTPDLPDPPPPGPVRYPTSILCPGEGDERCAPAFDAAQALDEAALDRALHDGLAAWRFEGQRGACAGCHSPDAFELARVGFTDEALRRRAADHVDEATAEAIVGLIHAQRQRYEMTELLHPAVYRPLQPGFEPWHQTTPGIEVTDNQAEDERDEAFMRHLTDDLGLLWATGRVDSLEAARQAYDELLAIDLTQLRVGVPFDHLSEDGFYGAPHMSAFEWFPGMASRPIPGQEAAFYALVDAYLLDPSDENLWGYYDAILTMTECTPDIGEGAALGDYERACAWMRLKWMSLQVLQHMLRHATEVYPDMLADLRASEPEATLRDHLELVISRNPIWEAGDFLRVQPLQRPQETACNDDNHPCTLLPPVLDDTIHDDPDPLRSRIRQSEIFQQSWFVMSWLRDPALLYESEGFATFIGDYLESVLLSHYDIHHAFIVARTAVSKSAASEWFDAPGFREGTGKIASLRTFSFKQLRDNLSPPPENDPRRATHERMFANFARMWIYLIEEDLRLSGEVYEREDVLRAVRFMRSWLVELEGAEDAAINQLVVEIEALAAQATELRSDANREANPGTGLQPTDRWDEFSEPYQGD